MEIKINKEIREYTESIFWGLSARQLLFSILAVIFAVAAYFIGKPVLGTELVSWVCIFVALPCILLGFVKYHGMTAEQFLKVWLQLYLGPKQYISKPWNLYKEVMK